VRQGLPGKVIGDSRLLKALKFPLTGGANSADAEWRYVPDDGVAV